MVALSTEGPLFDAAASLEARLLLAFPADQFMHHVVPARITKTLFDRLSSRSPFVARGFAGLQSHERNGRRYHCAASWMVFLGVKNGRPDLMLAGDRFMPGQIGVTGAGVQMLHGYTEKGLGTWMVGAVENLFADDWMNDEVGLIGLRVSIDLELVDGAALARDEPDFLRLGITWELPALPEQVLTVRNAA